MHHQAPASSSHERNYGIDLLRLVAAFYVVLLHTMSLGGLQDAAAPGSYQEQVCNILVILTYCAVNIFGIISGYVGYRDPSKKHTYYSYFPLWLTVVCYSILFVVFYQLLLPSSVGIKDLLMCFFPVTCNLYWYFSAFTLVYFLAPYLNKILQYSTDQELKQLLALICCFFVTVEYMGTSFAMARGYSAIWLLLLYLVGGILKKTGVGSRIPAYALCLGIILFDLGFFLISSKTTSVVLLVFELSMKVRNAYTSPIYLISAILHVLLFARFRFSGFWKKVLRFASPAAFSVYILNTNKLLWNNTLQDRFAPWAVSSPAGILARTVLFALTFVTAVIVIDFFRQKVFQLLGVQNWPKRLSCILQKKKVP